MIVLNFILHYFTQVWDLHCWEVWAYCATSGIIGVVIGVPWGCLLADTRETYLSIDLLKARDELSVAIEKHHYALNAANHEALRLHDIIAKKDNEAQSSALAVLQANQMVLELQATTIRMAQKLKRVSNELHDLKTAPKTSAKKH